MGRSCCGIFWRAGTMWSDRSSAGSRQELVERLRGVLPAARRGARTETAALGWQWDPVEVVGALWDRRGMAWLDQPRTRVFAEPLVRLSVCDGKAVVEGPCGRAELPARGFDLVEAALSAWGGAEDALLCGYFGYELGMELEDVVVPRRRAGDLPDLFLGLYDWRLE